MKHHFVSVQELGVMCSVLLREYMVLDEKTHIPLYHHHQLVFQLLPSHPEVMALVTVSLYRSFATV